MLRYLSRITARPVCAGNDSIKITHVKALTAKKVFGSYFLYRKRIFAVL
jgi:hypothetical protein